MDLLKDAVTIGLTLTPLLLSCWCYRQHPGSARRVGANKDDVDRVIGGLRGLVGKSSATRIFVNAVRALHAVSKACNGGLFTPVAAKVLGSNA